MRDRDKVQNSETLKHDPVEKVAMNMAEGLMDELEKEGKAKKKVKEIIQSRLLFKGFQLYTGMILTLVGTAIRRCDVRLNRGCHFADEHSVSDFLWNPLLCSKYQSQLRRGLAFGKIF
ncbi:MAG: hypothetical protein HY036_05770 [Nitrospirae bacterium]|nr:hypothetical protein [Nitrospirota bacterium]MBI3352068.1 hypothetical protein [Nitrospirota bacterium]